MSARTRGILVWVVASLVLVLVSVVIAISPWRQRPAASAGDRLRSMSREQLQDEKLRQEVLKLELENDKRGSFFELLPSYATIVTTLIAVIGVFITIWRQTSERELDRQQREDDSLRRLDERFTSIVSDLGSESEAVQASAAVSIVTFLKPEYHVFHDQVYTVLLANLKIEHSQAVNRLLVRAFEKAVRIGLQPLRERGEGAELDLARAHLDRIDLSSTDLSEADLGFTELRHANLTEAVLFRARGFGAQLEEARLSRANLNEARLREANLRGAQAHGANFVAADLKDTDLRKVQFHQAKMQAAHLDGAKLQGARFEQANLSDTYFLGADLDSGTLRSILRASKWQKAHFDPEIEAELEELAKASG